MTVERKEIERAVREAVDDAVDFLTGMMAFESVQGGEKEVQALARDAFATLDLETELVPIPEEITGDPEYTQSPTRKPYTGRGNLVIRRPGTGGGKSLLLNSHTDVVPVGEWTEGRTPVVAGGVVTGRGAADAKGCVAAMYLVNRALNDLGVETRGNLLTTVVIEEEVGGNGSLALIRQGTKADAVVVLEVTDLAFCVANRGAVWFQLDVEGRPTHMGSITEGVSAIDEAMKAVEIWRAYEQELIEGAKSQELFAGYERPTQLCVGMIRGGEWPSMVPAHCHVEGGIGFLPDRSLAQVTEDLTRWIESRGDKWLRSHYKLSFNKLHNDAFATPMDEAIVVSMRKSLSAAGLDGTPRGWISSCDARLWSKVARLPTVVFGPGTLKAAHSDAESVKVEDIRSAAAGLVQTIIDWCGT
ncbi:MAG TPA: M20/M25/M40 family metallo-hydrolase [Planctomycetota bacterium]|nr:M20/M25/M40 family metallo-hydrolase [Planctomycetota bacterium]